MVPIFVPPCTLLLLNNSMTKKSVGYKVRRLAIPSHWSCIFSPAIWSGICQVLHFQTEAPEEEKKNEEEEAEEEDVLL